MSSNVYVILGRFFGGAPEAVAICTTDEEYDDYIKTRDMTGLKTMAINTDHPKCPDIIDKIYDHRATVVGYFEDAPITKAEEEIAIEQECEFHSHMRNQIATLREAINKDFIKFSKDELGAIAEMMSIIRRHSDICTDEDACVDLVEEINYKELLKQSKMLDVPFKD